MSTTSAADAIYDVADRLAIINVINSYGYFVDELQLENFFSLFADSPTIEFWHGDRIISQGWAQFRELTLGRQETFRQQKIQRRHVLSAPRFDTQSAQVATGQVYLQLFKSADGKATLVTLGYYSFTVIKQHGDWKLQRWIAQLDVLPD